MTITEETPLTDFSTLELQEPIHRALADAGYTTPTPIQAQTIPPLLEGHDMVAQAQTGTGKTAAFALPLLSKIDIRQQGVQVIVLAPTRELANQVADGFNKYSKHLRGLRVLPVYGGSDYDNQLRNLRKGVHVVVGTPGRVMDHMRRGTLDLSNLKALVLDEADEMLRMGFIDDVEWILEQTPAERQTALFSATMPPQIRRIAKKYLNKPKEIIIESRIIAAESIRQRYLVVPGAQKANALIRILEMEEHDGVIVFVKTKTSTVEVAERLTAHGLSACALNGDLSQNLRERTVAQLKNGRLNIVVATDVAARGLDVKRISHVFNFDSPNDAETYVHRIGRTGRAGRKGEAILFLTRAEKRVLDGITRATEQPLIPMNVPSIKEINEKRVQRFNEQISQTLESKDTSFFKNVIQAYADTTGKPVLEVSGAVAYILQGKVPLLLNDEPVRAQVKKEKPFQHPKHQDAPPRRNAARDSDAVEEGMQRFHLDVGATHGVTASNIVGAIANEAGISSGLIGRIHIFNAFSTVDLPEGMPRKLWRSLKKVWVCDQQLNIRKLDVDNTERSPGPKGRHASNKSHNRPGSKPPHGHRPDRNRPGKPKRGNRPRKAA